MKELIRQLNEKPSYSNKLLGGITSKKTADKTEEKPPPISAADEETTTKPNPKLEIKTRDGKPSEPGQSWKTAGKKPSRRPVIVGKNNTEGSTVKTVPKMAYIYASRFTIDTTAEQLTKMLIKDFPEIKCEPFKPAFTTNYASFKITILLENQAKIMDPTRWPLGARITRFFHSRINKNNAT